MDEDPNNLSLPLVEEKEEEEGLDSPFLKEELQKDMQLKSKECAAKIDAS